jgi:hypothetical protein
VRTVSRRRYGGSAAESSAPPPQAALTLTKTNKGEPKVKQPKPDNVPKTTHEPKFEPKPEPEKGLTTTGKPKTETKPKLDGIKESRSFSKDAPENKPVVPKPTFKMKKLDPYFKGENIPNNKDNWLKGKSTVKYLNDSERAKLKATVGKDGKLYDSDGRLFDTSDSKTWDGRPKAIFVMDEYGDLYISKHQKKGEFHHSSILGGKPVSMAGEIDIVDGKLKYISNRSGHYQPMTKHLNQGTDYLKAKGLNFDSAKVWDEYLGEWVH